MLLSFTLLLWLCLERRKWLSLTLTLDSNTFFSFYTVVESLPPTFVSQSGPQTVFVGKGAIIRCEITGSAPLKVLWLKDQQPLPESFARYRTSCEHNEHTLEIQQLAVADGGLYVCTATNNVGSAESSVVVRVVDKPTFVRPLGSVAAVVGAPLRLECEVEEDTGAAVSWTRDGRKVHQSPDCKLSFEDRLISLDILKATLRDCGTYACTVTNPAGASSCSTEVKVQGKICLSTFVAFLCHADREES